MTSLLTRYYHRKVQSGLRRSNGNLSYEMLRARLMLLYLDYANKERRQYTICVRASGVY